MKLAKNFLKGSLVSACTLMTPLASAAHYTIGGSPNGAIHWYASTQFIFGTSAITCNIDVALVVTGGVVRSNLVTITGPSVCPQAQGCSYPWVWDPPTSDAGPNNVKIPVCINVPLPPGTVCGAGTVIGTLNNGGQFSFTANLGPSCMWKSTTPTVIGPPLLDAIYP